MGTAVTIGLDIAKSVFQVHGVDETGVVVIRRRLTRAKVLSFFAKIPAAWSGLKHVRPRIIGARAQQAWPRRAADAAELREGVCEAPEERCCRCGSDLRGGYAADHAVRGDQEP